MSHFISMREQNLLSDKVLISQILPINLDFTDKPTTNAITYIRDTFLTIISYVKELSKEDLAVK